MSYRGTLPNYYGGVVLKVKRIYDGDDGFLKLEASDMENPQALFTGEILIRPGPAGQALFQPVDLRPITPVHPEEEAEVHAREAERIDKLRQRGIRGAKGLPLEPEEEETTSAEQVGEEPAPARGQRKGPQGGRSQETEPEHA